MKLFTEYSSQVMKLFLCRLFWDFIRRKSLKKSQRCFLELDLDKLWKFWKSFCRYCWTKHFHRTHKINVVLFLRTNQIYVKYHLLFWSWLFAGNVVGCLTFNLAHLKYFALTVNVKGIKEFLWEFLYPCTVGSIGLETKLVQTYS